MNKNYAYIKDLEYFNERLNQLSGESEYPLENVAAAITDHAVLVKMGVFARLIAHPPPLLIEMDQFKLLCCEHLVRGYRIKTDLMKLCAPGAGTVSDYTILKIDLVSLLNDLLEDLLFDYKDLVEKEADMSNDIDVSLN